jgi:phytoene dehydrogenase-like protein
MTTTEIDRCDEPVDDYLRRQGATENLIKQLSLATVTIQGVYIHNASAASFMKFLKASYGCTTPMNPAFFTRPTGEALIAPLERFIRDNGGAVRVSEPVQAIVVDDSGGLSLTTASGHRTCDYIVLAMPGYLVPPLLPERHRGDAGFAPLAKLTSGRVVTLTLWYDTAWFPDHNVYISNREDTM